MRVATGSALGRDPLEAVEVALEHVAGGLDGRPADVVLAFLGASYTVAADDIGRRVRERLAPGHLLGATAGGVIADGAEIEDDACLSLWAAHLPGARLRSLRYPSPPDAPPQRGADVQPAAWPEPPEDARALLLLADPFSFPVGAFLAWLRQARPGLPVSGGLASGATAPGGNRMLLGSEKLDSGAVALAIGGDVAVRTLVSQGCRPIGRSYAVTRAEGNLIQGLGGAAPVERIRETYEQAGPDDRRLLRTGLHIGTVIDEYREEFGRGDFLVRAVVGAEPGTGALVVGEAVRVGQTVQFHVRDAASADEDLRGLLAGMGPPGPGAAALLFTCNGRGSRLFGSPDHDATTVRRALGNAPLAGFFCAGEFGPVGSRSYVHGFTASLLLLEPQT